MCNCVNQTCPYCDPGIEAFYQEKVKEAKAASEAMKADGIDCHYENLLDAKDIWYEYCELKRQEQLEEQLGKLEDESLSLHPENIEDPNSW